MEIGQENLYVDIRPWRAKLTQQIDQENNWRYSYSNLKYASKAKKIILFLVTWASLTFFQGFD